MESLPVQIVAIVLFIIALIVWVLLPLVPAILIYRLFPSTPVAVSGPLAGLTVKAGGAFGAYLLVLLLMGTGMSTVNQAIGGLEHQFWTVSMQVQLVDERGAAQNVESMLKRLEVAMEPDWRTVNRYEVRLKVPEVGGGPEVGGLPLTIVRLAEYGEYRIDWSSKEVDRNHFYRTIKLKTPIKLQRESSTTNPIGAAFQPTVGDSSRR